MKEPIEQYISGLLMQHDCVIVPGFGGFIGNYSPAVINPLHHTFFPPSKSLLFNPHLKQNDGLLASHLAWKEGIRYEEALTMISRSVETWNDLLESGEELVIEKVGRLQKEDRGVLRFEQDPEVNYLPDAYGLTSFVSPVIQRPGMQDRIGKKINRYINAPGIRNRKLTQGLKWAAAMALPVGLGIYLSLSDIRPILDLKESYSGFLFPKSAQVVKTGSSNKKAVLQKTLSAKPAVAVKDQPPRQDFPVTPAVTETAPVAMEKTITRPYAIIVGAFRFRENAENLVATLSREGYEAGIYDVTKTGLHRVTVGTFENKEEALVQLASVRTREFASAWLLSK